MAHGLKTFVDTNILVYAHDRGAGSKHDEAKALVEALWKDRSGVISTQVLQGFYVNARRKARNHLTHSTEGASQASLQMPARLSGSAT